MLNASAFYMDVSDYQASQQMSANSFLAQNAAEVEIYSVEVETKPILLLGLEFMGGFSYNLAL